MTVSTSRRSLSLFERDLNSSTTSGSQERNAIPGLLAAVAVACGPGPFGTYV